MGRNYDYSKLLGRMKEHGMTQKDLAKIIGSSPTTLSFKLNNRSTFSQSEIDQTCTCLNIPYNELGNYFFAHKV